jgi:hypothetical protein
LPVTDELIIIDNDRQDLMRLVVAFRGTPYRVTAVESAQPLQAATRLARREPAALVVLLSGRENVVDMRTLVEACRRTRLLFLVAEMPPSAAMARIVRSAGGLILSASESPIVIVATLITMLTHETAGQRGSI